MAAAAAAARGFGQLYVKESGGREGGREPLYIGNLFWARNDDFCKEEEGYGQISHWHRL